MVAWTFWAAGVLVGPGGLGCGSQDTEPVAGSSQRAARLQRVPQLVLGRCLGQGPADGLLGELRRDDDGPPTPHRVAEGGDTARVAGVPVDQGAAGSASARRRRE